MHCFLIYLFLQTLYVFHAFPPPIIVDEMEMCSISSTIRMECSSILILLAALSKPVWHIPLRCVQWKAPDNGQRNCPKHVEFHSKNKFEKLVHLIGFILRKVHKLHNMLYLLNFVW